MHAVLFALDVGLMIAAARTAKAASPLPASASDVAIELRGHHVVYLDGATGRRLCLEMIGFAGCTAAMLANGRIGMPRR